MSLEIATTSHSNGENPPNFETFIKRLKKFNKRSTVSIGMKVLSDIFKDENLRNKDPHRSQLLTSYGPKVIVLALAAANDLQSKTTNEDVFHSLCQDFLSVSDDYISDGLFEREAVEILSILKEYPKNPIPEKYLSHDLVLKSALEIYMARLIKSQHAAHLLQFEEIVRAYRLFLILNAKANDEPDHICKKIFNLDPLHLFRSGFMLFSISLAGKVSGKINFSTVIEDKETVEKLNINAETCRLAASHFSYPESQLREWFKELIDTSDIYKKFYPDPLYKTPVIHRDLEKRKNNEFIIPSPSLFLRGFIECFFSKIFEQNPNLSATFGEAIEEYIENSMRHIFGDERISRIEGRDTHADLRVQLDNCILILEIKSSLRGHIAQSVMSPQHIGDIWSLLYKAQTQCAQSMKESRERTDLPVIGIVVIADNYTVEAMPFQTFSERSGIYADLEIDGIEFLSWHSIEYTLSNTSVKNFSAALIEKWVNGRRQSVGDVIGFSVERGEAAHVFEHLEETNKILFPLS